MNQLECFRATVEHKAHQEFLFYADFTPDLTRRIREKYDLDDKIDLRKFFGMFNPCFVQPKPPQGFVEPDFSVYYEDVERPDGSFFNELGVLETPGSVYHFTGYTSPLRNAEKFEDLEKFPFQDFTDYSTNHMAVEVDEAHEQGRVAIGWGGHMYENSWQIRGYEQFLMDMVIQPEWCDFIFDKLKQRNLICACSAARAGVDFIRTCDDVAHQKSMMFAPEQWRKFIKSRWAEVYSAVKEINPDVKIWYHSDGNIEEIIPELIEIGVDILNPVQPECLDPVMLKKKYGKQLVFDGTIGTQTTMPFGSATDVRNLIVERIETLGYDGALILSPTHILEPEVPIENIEALVKTVKQYKKAL